LIVNWKVLWINTWQREKEINDFKNETCFSIKCDIQKLNRVSISIVNILLTSIRIIY
jgi:hypothetical protein